MLHKPDIFVFQIPYISLKSYKFGQQGAESES